LIESIEKIEASQPVKVVLVTASMQGGGAERVLSDMSNYWAKRGLQVTLATWSGPEIDDFYPVDSAVDRVWLDVPAPNTSMIAKARSNVMRISKLRSILRQSDQSVVLSFIDWSNVLTILAATGLPIRTVVSERVHAAYFPQLSWQWKLLRKLLYRRADVVVAQTDDVARWVEEHCKSRSCTIPNPLRELPLLDNEREPFILSVGRLYRQKGFDILLRAFANVQHDFSEWKVVIVGSGPELESLLSLRRELDLTSRVTFVKPVKDVESLMSRAGLVVQPSRFEGFPNVVLEAMGMGAAVISADCPSGPAEIIEDGTNGRLVPVDDVAALSTVMSKCMETPELRKRLGDNATKVRERYRQSKIMRLWERCLLPECREAMGDGENARGIHSET